MWRIGLILLLFSRIESLQCPERCDCVQTEQRLSNASSATPSFQISCSQVDNLSVSLLLRHFPSPATQILLRQPVLHSPHDLQQVLNEACQLLPHLTDFSITNSVLASQGDQLINEFLPFASITNPVLRGDGFSQLQILNLSNNSLKYLPAGLFRSCISLQTLDLSDNLIKNLETDTFHPLINLLRLDLRRNRLQSLSEDIFRNLSKLLTLDVSNNELCHITPTTFQYLSSLNTLILANNPLKVSVLLLGAGRHLQVVDVSTTGLHQAPTTLERTVRTLILKSNQLSAVRCGDFDSYSLLSSLHLDSNHISYIEEDALGRLELLNELHLSCNKLFHVPTSLPENLISIDLSFNLIQNLSNSDFLNLSLLKELSLNNNLIRYIEDNVFANLISLQTLDLSRNPILVLPPLIGLTHLQILNLSYLTNVSRVWRLGLRSFPVPNPGNIKELNLEASPALSSLFLADTGTLQEFVNITDLHLKFSNLTTLRRDVFILLPLLKILHLEGNPWHCDKEMLVAAEWVRRRHVSGGGAGNCATPAAFHGKPLIDLSYHNFQDGLSDNSQTPHTEIPGIFKAHPAVKDGSGNPLKSSRIYLKSHENSIESIDNGSEEIEKMSNARGGYLKGVMSVATTLPPSSQPQMPAAAGASRDNDNQLDILAAAVSNYSSASAKTAAENRSPSFSSSPHLASTLLSTATLNKRPIVPSIPESTTNIYFTTDAVIRQDTLSTETIASTTNKSKTWTVTNLPGRNQSRVSSPVSSRSTIEPLEKNTVPSDKSFVSARKDLSLPSEREEMDRGDRDEKKRRREGKGTNGSGSVGGGGVPGDAESTVADLGWIDQWHDSKWVGSDNNTVAYENKTGTGAGALYAPQPGEGASTPAPALVLLTVAGLAAVLATVLALVLLHVRRRARLQGYVLQDHELTIHSISNSATTELW